MSRFNPSQTSGYSIIASTHMNLVWCHDWTTQNRSWSKWDFYRLYQPLSATKTSLACKQAAKGRRQSEALSLCTESAESPLPVSKHGRKWMENQEAKRESVYTSSLPPCGNMWQPFRSCIYLYHPILSYTFLYHYTIGRSNPSQGSTETGSIFYHGPPSSSQWHPRTPDVSDWFV